MTQGTPIRVLIVDDQRVFAEALTLALSAESGIEVAGPPVLRGDEAAGAASERAADVVLMDLRLPGIDGIEATRRVRSARPEAAVVILTSEAGGASLPDAAAAGACGYLDKTVALGDVGAAVRAAHAGDVLLSLPAAGAVSECATGQDRRAFASLTPREDEVLRLLAEGLANRDIAQHLGLSVRTVDTHIHNVLLRLDAHSKLEAVVRAIRAGVVRVE